MLQTKGKAAIDVVCNPLGKSGGSLIQQVMIVSFGSLATSTPYLGAILLVIVLTWMAAANSLSKQARPHAFLRRSAMTKRRTAGNHWAIRLPCSPRGLAEHLPLNRVPEHMFWCWCWVMQKSIVKEDMFLCWFKHRNRVPEHVFLCWYWVKQRNRVPEQVFLCWFWFNHGNRVPEHVFLCGAG